MRNRPRLSLTCSRCGQQREGIIHVCHARSGRAARRKATPRLKLEFGKCETCKKPIGNPLTHVCSPRSDFRKRNREAAQREAAQREAKRKREAAAKKRKANQHDYLMCKDEECKRSLCIAYKTGWGDGHQAGFSEGFDAGFEVGQQSCPLPHGGSGG